MCILISVFLFSLVHSDIALSFGERFYDKQLYDEAITEYKRYIFFNPHGEQTSAAYSKIALAYRNQQEWLSAIEAFRMAILTAQSDSLRYEAELALAVTYIANGNYSAAELVLLKLEMTIPPQHIKQRAAFLRGIATLYANKWDHAKEAFEAYFLSDPDPFLQAKVDSLIEETKHFYYRSPESARQLSMIIPGLGQIYAGDWGNGINSFVLNGSMIAWMGYKVFNRYFSDAWVIYYFLFRRYYAGNMYNAARIVEEKNEALDKKQAERIINLFLEE